MYVHLCGISQMFVVFFSQATKHHKTVPDHIASVCGDYKGIAAYHEGHVTVGPHERAQRKQNIALIVQQLLL